MKACEYLARKYAQNWTVIPKGTETIAVEEAYLVGFNTMKDLAVGLLEDFNDPRLLGLARLTKAIGTAKVNPEDGKRLE